jgi:hypothetical protein
VQVALQASALGIAGLHDSLPRRTQIVHLRQRLRR